MSGVDMLYFNNIFVYLSTDIAVMLWFVLRPLCFQVYQSKLPYCKMPERKPFERLPQYCIPVNYALSIKPDLIGLTFSGTEDISIEVGHLMLAVRASWNLQV